MGAGKINTRLDLQWPDYTLCLQAKKSKNPRTASEHQEVYDKNTKESHGETCRQPSAHIIRHPRGGRDVLTYIGRSEGHNTVVARHT